jgi:hypothetical protein
MVNTLGNCDKKSCTIAVLEVAMLSNSLENPELSSEETF